MHRHLLAWIPAALAAGLVPAACAAPAQVYVAPNGSDANPGTQERPFATLEKARDAARALKAKGAVTITLRGGTYTRRETFTLGEEDSGSKGAPVTYAAAPGERVVLFGGTPLEREWFVPVKDAAVLERVISPEVRGKLLQCDLKAHGVTDTGELSRHGYHKANSGKTPPSMLYVGGQRMTLSRWPNPDQHFPEMLWQGDRQRKGVVARSGIVDPGPNMNDADFLNRGGTFTYAFDRPAQWTRAEDLWLDGVFAWSWEWSYNKVAKIDPVRKEISLRYGEVSGLKDVYSGNFFFAENLLEEIDQPGEYVIDRAKGVLYFLPEERFARGALVWLSTLAETMLEVKGASDVTFRGLVLDTGRAGAFSITNGTRVRLERCEITNFAGTAGSIGGTECALSACYVHHVGGAGVWVGGGDLKTLAPANNGVEDCEFHDWAWYQRVYTPAVGVSGVGQRIAHNHIHHCPHGAVLLQGNDHVIEYNDFHHICEEFIDLGVIYVNVGHKPLERGWVIRRNYFHDLAATADSPINIEGVYLDHGSQGGLIEENVFHRIGHASRTWAANAIKVSGIHTLARNNLFIDCTTAWRDYAKPLPAAFLAGRYRDYKYADYFATFDLAKAPHVAKYPEVSALLPGAPPMTREQMWHRFERNVIWNPNVPRFKPDGIWVENKKPEETPVDPLIARDNWIADADPGFVDAAKGNFALRPDAPVFARIPGFATIPFAEIGPRAKPGPEGAAGAAGYDPTHDPQQPKAVSAGAPPKAGRPSHPDAAWFPRAGFGWFMHWGIHTVEGLQPSWAMIKDYPYSANQAFNTPEKYWALAPRFNPQAYDPDRWMAAAKKAGFTYVVLTAKHHDGYAMWPTKHGDFGVRQFLNGRDLIKPYVEACRRHGLKVGLYFSQRDWRYPGYPPCYVDFDHKKGHNRTPPIADPVKNQAAFDAFMAYTRGQLEELLTQYGTIDLLWFDGFSWPGAKSPDPGEVFAWIRSLQPGIVINNRWPGAPGDFETPECHLPKGRPQGWWETCQIWDGHWGYNIGSQCRPNTWVLEQLVTCRKWGGNFLLNCSPGPDGAMKPSFYERCDELAAWMAHSRESLIGADASPGDDLANVPITRREKVWYLHVLPKHQGPVVVKVAATPAQARLLRTGAPLKHRQADGVLTIEIPASERTALDDVVAVQWTEEP